MRFQGINQLLEGFMDPLGNQGTPGEEHRSDEYGSQLSARDLRLLGKEGLGRLKEGPRK